MLNTTVSLSPDHADAYDYLGQAYFKKEEYQDSVDSFNKALEIQPNHTRAKTNLGVAQWKLESVNKTISELTENIENVNQDTLHHSMTETSSQAPLEGYIKVSVDEVSGLGGWLPVVGMSIVFGLIGVIANTYTYSQIFSDGRWESQQFLVR